MDHRQRQAEWMDEPGADPRLLDQSLRFIRFINRCLGYTRATLSHFDRFSRTWDRARPITILDIATGSADVPQALLKWADRRGFDLRIVALDLSDDILRRTASRNLDPRIHLLRADAANLPFADNSFDYAVTSMFLHHLDDDVILRVLREMDRVSRRGLLAADLVRHPRALFWIRLFTLFSNPMVRHDAIVSVRQSFRQNEITPLASQAGLTYAHYHPHFAHRFILSGEKHPPDKNSPWTPTPPRRQ